MKTIAMKVIGSLALSTIALGGAAQAGETRYEPAQVVVKYGDLDLSRSEGVNQLYARLKKAAAQVCYTHDGVVPERRVLFLNCRRDALEDAVTQVASQALTSLHDEHSVRTAGSR